MKKIVWKEAIVDVRGNPIMFTETVPLSGKEALLAYLQHYVSTSLVESYRIRDLGIKIVRSPDSFMEIEDADHALLCRIVKEPTKPIWSAIVWAQTMEQLVEPKD